MNDKLEQLRIYILSKRDGNESIDTTIANLLANEEEVSTLVSLSPGTPNASILKHIITSDKFKSTIK